MLYIYHSKGVISAAEMLRSIGDDNITRYEGKKVVVVSGGNVAMDVARSSIRFGADSVNVIYIRRKVDMTALPEEVQGAEAEGCNILELISPVAIEKNEDGTVKGIRVNPQMTSKIVFKRKSQKIKMKMKCLFLAI